MLLANTPWTTRRDANDENMKAKIPLVTGVSYGVGRATV